MRPSKTFYCLAFHRDCPCGAAICDPCELPQLRGRHHVLCCHVRRPLRGYGRNHGAGRPLLACPSGDVRHRRLHYGDSRSGRRASSASDTFSPAVGVAILAYVIGSPMLRLKGYYLACATFALILVTDITIPQLGSLTGDTTGFSIYLLSR